MPEFIIFSAFILAAVTGTGAMLDRKRVRRSRRVLAWVGLSLLLPFFVLAFLMYMIFRDGWRFC